MIEYKDLVTVDGLYPSAAKALADCPPSGGGVHRWLFETALKLRTLVSMEECEELLIKYAVNGQNRRAEIVEAIEAAYNLTYASDWSPAPKWSKAQPEIVEKVLALGHNAAELTQSSPIPVDDLIQDIQITEELIDALFPGNPLLCCNWRPEWFQTKSREDWRGELATCAGIVPSPMTDIYGITKNGKYSQHALSSTGDRRYLITDFDFKGNAWDERIGIAIDNGDQNAIWNYSAAAIWYLKHIAKGELVMVVSTGRKGLHAWWNVCGKSEIEARNFFDEAVIVGADIQVWNINQFVRMPDGTREDTRKRQGVIYFDSNNLPE
jgi:hypothetical protein